MFALNDKMPDGKGNIPDVFNFARRDYGARVGIWRIADVLSKYGIRATVALNSNVCDSYPEIIEETSKLGWEFMGHNETNTRYLYELDPEEEKQLIHRSLSRIAKATGKKPVGWLGSGLQETWHTLDYLIEEGLSYVADWVNDDQPYVMDVSGRSIVSLPYSVEINDKPAYETYNRTADEFEMMICRQFDTYMRKEKNRDV